MADKTIVKQVKLSASDKLAIARQTVRDASGSTRTRKKAKTFENPFPRLAGFVGKMQRKRGLKGAAANVVVASGVVIGAGATYDTITGESNARKALQVLREEKVPGANFLEKKTQAATRVISALKP